MTRRHAFDNTEVTPTEIADAESFTAPAEALISESLESANVSPTSTAINLDINTDRFGTIRAMYDSGASLNIVDALWALKNLKKYVKNIKEFYCTTANGDIVMRQYVPVTCTNGVGGTPFIAKFYLLRNSPYRFIMSRGMFWKLGYKIMRPNGQFIVQSQSEETSGDLYDKLFQGINYPIKGEHLLLSPSATRDAGEFLCHLARKHEQWEQQDPLLQYEPRIGSVAMPEPWLITHGKEVLHTIDATTAKRWETRQNADEVRRALPKLAKAKKHVRVGLTREQILEEAKTIHGKFESATVKQQFLDLLVADGKRYAAHMADIGVIPDLEFEIRLKKDARPYHSRPYPHSYEKTLDSKRQIEELLEGGFIRVSDSSWASPYLMVPKPTRKGKKEWRMAIDYRGLNALTIRDRYPIPSMRDLYAKLRGGRIFSCLDLRSGYHHISVKPEDRHKTAFITEYGLFEWTRMTFGFCNAPSVFQRAMDKVFGDMEQVLVYIDDIVIATRTEEEHIKVLTEVYARLQRHGMTLRLIKCKFFVREVKYLGLIVNETGVRCDEEYVKKVLTFKCPTTIKELERYLGMVAWLGRFIPNLSKLTSALTSIGKKQFVWSEVHQQHFEAIQRAVHNTKLLRHPNLELPFYVQTDASEHALGAVLLQNFGGKHLEPIEFISRKLTDCETRWHCSEQELVAVVYACNRWIKYLLPKPFTVYTDHKNLEVLFTKGPGMRSRKLQRWIVQLQQFDLTAKYLPGKDNYIADFLSRDVLMICALLPIMAASAVAPTQDDSAARLMEFFWTGIQSTHVIDDDEPAMNHIHAIRVHQICALQTRRSRRLRGKARVDYDEEKMYDLADYGGRRLKPRHQLPELAVDRVLPKHLAAIRKGRDWSRILSVARFRREFAKDGALQTFKKAVESREGISVLPRNLQREIEEGRFEVSDEGLLFRKSAQGRMVPIVPASMQNDLAEYFHTARVFQHQGYHRTYATVRQWYYWRGMKETIREFCTQCQVCITTRISRTGHAKGTVTLIEATRPFEMVSMDLVGPLPICSSNSRYLLTIMDRFTRYVAAIPLEEVTAEIVATRFFNEWIMRYGTPETILSDNGTQFTSEVLSFTMALLNVRHRFSTIYHPECNGQIERWHRFLKQRLSIRQKENAVDFLKGDDWDIYVPTVVFSYNASVHSVTQHSPFQLLYGRLPTLPTKLAKLSKVKLPQIRGYDDYLRFLVQALSVIRNRTLQITHANKCSLEKRLNHSRTEFDFKIGELVYRRALGLTGNTASFTDKWLGPYEITGKTEKGAFELRHVHDARDKPLINGKYLVRVRTSKRKKGRNKK